MKKLIISILLFSFLLTGSASYASGLSNTSTTLSEMTPTECIAFIQTQGLVIPAELEDYVRLGEFVQQIIEIVEQNPSATFMWNYDVTLAFANEIKAVVNDWYGVAILPENTTYFPRISSGLSDNTPVGVWYEKYRFFNCYAYALGYRYSPTGEIYFVNPGSYSRPDLFDINDPVSEWADLTVLDLHNKDYACVYATTIYSDAVELSNTHSVICLRRGTPNSGYSDLPPDFHYMSLTGSSWYHKPGGSQPLRYHHLPYEDNWTNEAIADGNLGIITHTYTGTIHYFAYRESHSLTSVYNNFHYHLGDYHYFEYATTCRYCGEVTEVTLTRMECSGPPCSVPDLASISPEDLST